LGNLGNRKWYKAQIFLWARDGGVTGHANPVGTLAMRAPLLALLPLVACSCTAETMNYAGTLRPIAGTCDPTMQAALTRRDKTIIFAPAAGTLILRGQLSDQNTLAASLTLTDPNKQPYYLSFQGHLDGRHILGTYATPRCRYTADLTLTHD
jgi:hypothetical protein